MKSKNFESLSTGVGRDPKKDKQKTGIGYSPIPVSIDPKFRPTPFTIGDLCQCQISYKSYSLSILIFKESNINYKFAFLALKAT